MDLHSGLVRKIYTYSVPILLGDPSLDKYQLSQIDPRDALPREHHSMMEVDDQCDKPAKVVGRTSQLRKYRGSLIYHTGHLLLPN